MISISAAGDGTVWALDTSEVLLQNTEDAIAWAPQVGILVDVGAASDGGVYGVDAAGSLYSWQGVAAGWHYIKPSPNIALTSVSVGSASLVWATDKGGTMYRYDPGPQSLTPMPSPPNSGPVQSLGVASDGTVCCLSDGALFRFGDGSWHSVPGAPAKLHALGVGTAGYLWVIDAAGTISQYDGDGRPWLPGPTLAGAVGERISCGDDGTVWILDTRGGLHQLDVGTQSWVPVPAPGKGTTTGISAGSAASTWAVQADGSVYQYVMQDSIWSDVGLVRQYRQVSAQDQKTLWACDESGWLFGLSRPEGGKWTIPISADVQLTWVSVSPDGTVLGADPGGNLVRFDPGPQTVTPLGRPTGGGPIVQVAAGGPRLALVLCSTGRLYSWDGSTFQPADSGLPAAGVISMSVLPGGAAYAVGTDHRLYLSLDEWLPVSNGPLLQVSASSLEQVWGISLDGYAVQLGTDHDGEGTGGAGLPGWDDQLPFDEVWSTHLWIVNRAAVLAGTYGGLGAALVNLVKPGQGKLNDPFHDNLCQGLMDADYMPPYDDVEKGQRTYKSHFYDPDTGHNYMGETEPTALTRGASLFNVALSRHQDGNLAEAGYYLGLSLHYFTDLTQPMHAANYTYWFSRPVYGYHTDFESYAMTIQSTVSPPVSYQPSSLGNDPAAHIIATARKSKSRMKSLWSGGDYYGMTDKIRASIRAALPPILQEAITATARYLIAWITEATSAWADDGGSALAGAGACVIGGTPFVSVIKPNGDLAVNYVMGTSRTWDDRGTPSGTTIAEACGSAAFADKAHIYVLGADGKLYLNISNSAGFEWQTLGVPLTSTKRLRMGLGATATSTSPVAYVLSSNGEIFYHTQRLAQKWTHVGAPPGNSPVVKAVGAACYKEDYPCTAVITADGNLHVCGRGTNGQPNQWTTPGTPPGVGIAKPVGICCNNRAMHVAVLGSDGNLWHANFNDIRNEWRWENLYRPSGKQLDAGIGFVAPGNSPLFYLVTTTEGELWMSWWQNSHGRQVWSTAGSPSSEIRVRVPAGVTADDRKPHTFVIGTDNGLWDIPGTGALAP
ncbi:hypothetical protein OG496_00490 [Streptomyces sp. NBC_00988]|uniref:zinc dependent phospholipase C family protein n=1 Tax=Streptomyces sp. NBC_00988 TaxID=2903704 RepID=UPI00386EFA91|nr:hypothetical protein OG496_00490 [Streptomyces sp. NBC_00988]